MKGQKEEKGMNEVATVNEAQAPAPEALRPAYTPKSTLFAQSEQLRTMAVEKGPSIFEEIVEQCKKFKATGDYKQAPLVWFAERFMAAGMDAHFKPYGGPFAFVVKLAYKVAGGWYFMEDIDFAQVSRKGGTLAEWCLQIRRGFDNSHIMQERLAQEAVQPRRATANLIKKAAL